MVVITYKHVWLGHGTGHGARANDEPQFAERLLLSALRAYAS
jgi:hypothetical protein